MNNKTARQAGRSLSVWLVMLLPLVCLLVGGKWGSGKSPGATSLAGTIDPSEIKPGMKGYGLSVFKGRGIERFEVEVVGVVPNALLRQDMILIMCHGQDLEKTMIIAGMSGSPIFIEDRLAGALAYGWSFSRDPLAGVTPIKNMVATVDKFTGSGVAPDQAAFSDNYLAAWMAEQSGKNVEARAPARDPSLSATSMVPIAAPLYVSGLSPQGLEYLATELAPFNLVPVAAGGMSSGKLDRDAAADLQPGAAVGGALVTGDMSMVAVGTLTWRDGDRVAAFGHPFLTAGPLRMPLVAAEIHTVVNTANISFKLGTPTAVVGELVADEQSGIVGRLGVQPRTVPVDVTIRRDSVGYKDKYHFEVVEHPALTPIMVKTLLMEVIGAAVPSFDPTTVRVHSRFTLSNHGEAEYEDIYAVQKGNFTGNFLDPVSFFAANSFERIQIESLTVDLEIVDDLKVAVIESAWAESDEVEPGSTVEIGVVLRPYNEDPVTFQLSVPVPADLESRAFKLKITGGNRGDPDHASPRKVEDMISFMNSVYLSTQLVVAYSAPGQSVDVQGERLRDLPPSVSSMLTPNNDTEAGDAPLLVILVKDTPYVIVGSQVLALSVSGDGNGNKR